MNKIIKQNKKRVTKKSKKNHKMRNIILILVIVVAIYYIRNNIITNRNNTIATNQNNNEKYMLQKDAIGVTEKSSFPTKVYGVPVNTQLIESNTKARPGTKRKIRYIVIHETDNFTKGTDAKNHAKFLSDNNTESTSWHYTVDDKEIYHHIPDNEIAYHAATEEGNRYGIGIELCVNSNGNFEKTFNNATKLVAYLLKEYDLTIYDVKTHHDFSGKDCPHSILKNKRMDEFIRKVKRIMNEKK